MPDVRIGIDGGGVIVVNGVAYTKDAGQPSEGAVTGVAMKTNIVDVTWSTDDNNVAGGPLHRTWSACDIAVSGWGTGNQAGVGATGGLDYLFTAPSQGVARCAHSNISYDYTTAYYVNDILFGTSGATTGWAGPTWPYLGSTPYAILLNSGDVVKFIQVGGTGQYLWFLPYVY